MLPGGDDSCLASCGPWPASSDSYASAGGTLARGGCFLERVICRSAQPGPSVAAQCGAPMGPALMASSCAMGVIGESRGCELGGPRHGERRWRRHASSWVATGVISVPVGLEDGRRGKEYLAYDGEACESVFADLEECYLRAVKKDSEFSGK
ncbi:hypothetical protein DFH09DRAFT_1323575 [Mycena vulgaris]|nr:hypothetical protein DFH09DRAFT_1323575 [Mycena vulgaris]